MESEKWYYCSAPHSNENEKATKILFRLASWLDFIIAHQLYRRKSHQYYSVWKKLRFKKGVLKIGSIWFWYFLNLRLTGEDEESCNVQEARPKEHVNVHLYRSWKSHNRESDLKRKRDSGRQNLSRNVRYFWFHFSFIYFLYVLSKSEKWLIAYREYIGQRGSTFSKIILSVPTFKLYMKWKCFRKSTLSLFYLSVPPEGVLELSCA